MDTMARRLRLARTMLMGSVVLFVLGIAVRLFPLLEEDIAQLLSHIIICYAGAAVAMALFLRNIALFGNRPRLLMWAITLDVTLLCFSIVLKVIVQNQESLQMYTICNIICYVAFALLAILGCVDVVRPRRLQQNDTTQDKERSDNI